MTDIVAELSARLGHVGINLVGATHVAAYDSRVVPARRVAPRAPGARSAIVLGNGGGALWEAARAHLAGAWTDDPLDRFTRDVVTAAVEDIAGASVIFPFVASPTGLDFQVLAELAGLGRPSLVGVLVHPEYGPWIALRAAVLVPRDVTAPRPADGFDPCPSCVERPCIVACPVGAVGPEGWNVRGCMTHRLADDAHCATGCGARLECVYGRPQRYPAEALAYHQAAARRTMVAYARDARKD